MKPRATVRRGKGWVGDVEMMDIPVKDAVGLGKVFRLLQKGDGNLGGCKQRALT